MKNSVRRLVSTAVLAALAVPTTSFATNGYFGHGYSAYSNGLAGAGVALPQDAMASATNPAGMVWVDQSLDVGAAYFSPHRQYTVNGNPSGLPGTFGLAPGTVESDSNDFYIPHFGVNWKIGNDQAIGVAIYGNGGMNTDYPAFTNGYCGGPATGTFCAGATGVDLAQLFINTSYAFKLNAKSSVGISLIAAYQRFKATGVGSFAGFSSDPSALSNNGYDTSTGFGAKIGWQGEVASNLTLGVSYQTKTHMRQFQNYAGLFAGGGNFDIPATATIGLAWKLKPTATLVFDVQQIYYNNVDSIANPISYLVGSSNSCATGNTSKCLGGSDGAGFGWDNMTIYKLGYQWATSQKWTWRVGYSYGKQPIPDSEVMFNILAPAVIEQHITFGFTNTLNQTNEWSFAAMYAPSKTISGPNPMEVPGQQTIDLKMYEYQVEASYTHKF